MATKSILVVDDDEAILGLLAAQLRREGFLPLEAGSGAEALSLFEPRAAGEAVALVILDIMLAGPEGEPDGPDGFEVLESLRRRRPGLPVILLSARREDADKILGFGLGADDYVTKPFSPAELMARVRARLRRPQGEATSVEAGPFRLDLPGCILYKEGRALELSARELELMRLFIENPGRVFTKAQIYSQVWGGDFYEDNAVMVHISRLRDKVEADSRSPRHILTVRGLGYKFDPAGGEKP
jgi:two-component system response regulator RegX3